MFTLTMSTRGQFVLPKEIRARLKLLPGCKVDGLIDERGRLVLVPALHEPQELFRDRPPVTRRLSVAQMDRAIGRAVRRDGV
jgi:bifunctional DNA-binding transcriptional regulator/antitoxin component of YhaV-PrlF toxin-antitoxin module